MKLDRNVKIAMIIAVITTVMVIIGGAYAFFTANVSGNETASSIRIDTASLSLVYNGSSNVSLPNALPGSSVTKTFTVENNGSIETSYNLYFDEIINTFANPDHLVYTLSSTNNGGSLSETIVPSTSSLILSNIAIGSGVTQTYTMRIWFKETGSNQNDNMGKEFNGKVKISVGNTTDLKVTGINPITLLNSKGNNLLNYKIYGNSVQEGDPTPANPIPVYSLGETPLPTGYTQLEYIESTGTQYIDTDYIPNINSKIDVKFEINQYVGSYSAVFGTRNSSGAVNDGFALSTNSRTSYIMDGTEYVASSILLNTTYNVVLSKNGYYVNGTLIRNDFSGTVNCIYPLLLFARNRNDGPGSFMVGKIRYTKIYDNNILVRNMIPARRNSDNAIGMFDTVNNLFYSSAVAEEFLAGNEVNAIEITSSGKNLLSYDDFSKTNTNIWKPNQNVIVSQEKDYYQVIYNQTTSTPGLIWNNAKHLFEIGKTYTISMKVKGIDSTTLAFSFFNNCNFSKTILTNEFTTISHTCTLSNFKTNYLLLYKSKPTLYSGFQIKWMQIEEGESVTSYEPYHKPITTTIDLTGHEALRKVGDVADYIDYANSQIVRNIGKKVFNGTETITMPIANSFRYINATLNTKKATNSITTKCTNFVGDTYTHVFGTSPTNDTISSGPDVIISDRFGFYSTNFATVAELQSYLLTQYTEGTPVTVYYQLATPTYEPITLPEIPTYGGTTIISIQDNLLESSNIELDYQANIE